jgi:A/G-specific adenine glycosylase
VVSGQVCIVFGRGLVIGAQEKHLCTEMKSKKTAARSNRARVRDALAQWFRKAGRDLPWRRTTDPYAILVSEMMCQQTQVGTVIDYYVRWMKRFPTFHALAHASEDDVLHAWAGLGYYSRATNLHRAAREVVAKFGGHLPARPDAAVGLPGVGRYTAGAVATFAFDFAVPVVDANIARVLARVFDLQTPIDSAAGANALWTAAASLLPERHGRLHNSALMELGALVCTPREPLCRTCPIRGACATRDPESLPRKKPARKTVPLTERCVWITDKNCLVLEQQRGPRWRGLWKLPAASRRISDRPLAQLTYAFTHHRVTLRVHRGRRRALRPNEKWVALEELPNVALAAPHARAIRQISTEQRP